MLAGGAVDAARAIGGRAAPNALVSAGAVAVLTRGRMDTTRAIRPGATPFTPRLVVAMLVFASW